MSNTKFCPFMRQPFSNTDQVVVTSVNTWTTRGERHFSQCLSNECAMWHKNQCSLSSLGGALTNQLDEPLPPTWGSFLLGVNALFRYAWNAHSKIFSMIPDLVTCTDQAPEFKDYSIEEKMDFTIWLTQIAINMVIAGNTDKVTRDIGTDLLSLCSGILNQEEELL